MEESSQINYHVLDDPSVRVATVVLYTFTSLLSIYGSVSIIVIIIKKKAWNYLFQRIVLGLSVADIVATTAAILQPFLVPSSTGLKFAIGNQGTCTMVGFFFIFALTANIYSAELSLFYMVTVSYHWSAAKASKILEPWVHLVPWVPPIILGSFGLFYGAFNPSVAFGICYFNHYPLDCQMNPEIDCTRGANAARIALAVAACPVGAAAVGIICTWTVFRTVRKQSQRCERYAFATMVHMKRQESVAWQAVWYTAAFLNCFLVNLIASLMALYYTSTAEGLHKLSQSPKLVSSTLILLHIFYPIQGFLNWIIFVRPTLIRWKDAYPYHTWSWAYAQILAGRPTPTTRRTEYLVNPKHGSAFFSSNGGVGSPASPSSSGVARILSGQEGPPEESVHGGQLGF